MQHVHRPLPLPVVLKPYACGSVASDGASGIGTIEHPSFGRSFSW